HPGGVPGFAHGWGTDSRAHRHAGKGTCCVMALPPAARGSGPWRRSRSSLLRSSASLPRSVAPERDGPRTFGVGRVFLCTGGWGAGRCPEGRWCDVAAGRCAVGGPGVRGLDEPVVRHRVGPVRSPLGGRFTIREAQANRWLSRATGQRANSGACGATLKAPSGGSVTAVEPKPVPQGVEATRPFPARLGPKGSFIYKAVTTTDAKVLGVMYLTTSMAFFLIGGLMALMMRGELARPGLQFLSPEQFNQLFTMHG